MRFKKKYKDLANIKFFLNSIPNRVQKFKRPKWLKLKQSLSNTGFKKTCFQKFSVIKLEYKSWEKINNDFKSGINLKRSLASVYDFSVPVKALKKYSKLVFLKKNTCFVYLYPIFKIDVLLYKVNFLTSIYESRQSLSNNQILVNGTKVSNFYKVKVGDIIKYNQNQPSKSKLIIKEIPEFFFFFFEIDYYTKTIIVIKDLHSLSILDLQNFNMEYINFKPITDYLKSV